MEAREVFDLIKTRRSVRRFKDEPVEPALVRRVLEAGRWAPSGWNNQPWRFAVVTDPGTKERIGALSDQSKMIQSAAVVISVFLHKPSIYHEVKDHQSIGACLQNMWLMAHGLGLGAVWVGQILENADQVRQVLELGPELELMAVLLLGWPKGGSQKVERKPLHDLLLKGKGVDEI